MLQIKRGELEAEIDLKGAWLTRFESAGEPVLFERTRLLTADNQQKLRGGCHVCLPNFGPGGDSDLSQHGFGRELDWQLAEKGESHVVLQLSNDHSVYSSMFSMLRYELTDRGIVMTLTVENKGESAIPVAPAFHPYYAVKSGEAVSLNQTTLDLDNLGETDLVDGVKHSLRAGDQEIELSSINLPTWAIWTDKLGDYVCVEPSHSGNSFQDDIKQAFSLKPAEVAEFGFTISW